MPLRNPFKLEKLKINVFGNRRRAGLPQCSFKVMFNPTSLSARHENSFQQAQAVNGNGGPAIYSSTRPDGLKLVLVLDGTGVAEFGLTTRLGRGAGDVAAQVKRFLDLCFHMDGDLHEPKFLNIQWGELDFDCRLAAVDINYTRFDPAGMPLRAELTTDFIEDLNPAKGAHKAAKKSPDLTHVRVVRSGDSLPLLAKAVYGSAGHYLWLARVNGLDDFRNLTPGQSLHFPPLPAAAEPGDTR